MHFRTSWLILDVFGEEEMKKNIDPLDQIKTLYLDVKKGIVPKALILSGKEDYPILSYLKQVKDAVSVPEVNISEFRDVFSYEQVFHAFETLPMMSEFRLVLLNNSGYFKWNKDERLASLFSDVPEHIRLIVHEAELNKISSSYKKLSAQAQVIVLDRVSSGYLTGWMKEEYKSATQRYGRSNSRPLPAEVVKMLAEIGTEKGMHEVKNALEYLASLDQEITVSDAHQYFGAEEDVSVWALYDGMASDNAVVLTEKLLDSADPFELFGRMHALIRGAYRCQQGVFSGTPFMQRVSQNLARKIPPANIQSLLEMMTRIDVEMKSTSASKENLLIEAAIRIELAKQESTKVRTEGSDSVLIDL